MTSRAETAGRHTRGAWGSRHRGVFFSSAEDLRERVVPRIRAASGDGARVVLGVAPATRAVLLAGLSAADASGVEPLEAAELYDAPGRTLAALHARARAEHPGRVLVVGEPPLSHEDPVQVREWHRLDSVLTHALAGTGVRLLCLHDTRALSERVRRDVRRTHPVLVAGGEEHSSPDYVDPAEFSAPDLARRLPAPAGEQRSLEFGADLASLRTAVTELAEKAEVPRERLSDLVLAVNELAANAVEHGGGAGSVTLWRSRGWALCDVADRGAGLRDPLCGYHPADPLSPRGYGLWITRQLCEYLEISGGPDGTLVRLHFRV